MANEKYHPDKLLASKPFRGEGKKIIGIGASTGGVDAIARILQALPLNLPPIVITQHIPEGFSTSFAHRLDNISALSVVEVTERMTLKPSCAYLAPGGRHMLIENKTGEYIATPLDGDRITRHKPSVDIMFRSLNNAAGKNALAIIMTGMGDDGSIGIHELFLNGSYTIAQDEDSCIVFGMPKQAISRGSICDIVSLDNIPEKIVQFSHGNLKRKK
ncbi:MULTISPECIES: CheB methylesterase domain-containing protein [Helicobacter]|uniref:protein-glutamate methylesterase n=1 Tax=Helicobacter ibis TaxID=2962633 RepID=A0ABT4VDM5_9HELI|nr:MULTISPECIES: CheB methylesterase domain-containing protein [Helicobacter]MDA3966570.1 CheB methylesterase domain-containing protein [Helicobacter sp. WB40]MDA3968814.1 CheB methylesterase domain-containing protein [Helicobacter ibis]